MTKIALQVEGLSVAYAGASDWAVKDVSFALPAGSLCAIVGPNGSGKSTTLKAIVGAIEHQKGTITVLGKDARQGRKEVIYVPQRSEVDWDFPLTVRDIAKQGLYGELGLLRRPSKAQLERVDAALEELGITKLADRQIGELSGGQQQRAFLARAVVQHGEILMMDEPFQGVDAATETSIIELLRDRKARGKTMILVHHDLSTVSDYFDHVLLLNSEQIAFGPTEDVYTVDNLQEAYGGRLAIFGEGRAAI